MVALTRLNGHRFFVNSDLIKYSEAAPDTVLALVTGEKLVVTESPEQVMRAMLEYRAEVLRTAWPEAAAALSARLAQDATLALHESREKQEKGSDASRCA
jgi:flagellar protein FlbD